MAPFKHALPSRQSQIFKLLHYIHPIMHVLSLNAPSNGQGWSCSPGSHCPQCFTTQLKAPCSQSVTALSAWPALLTCRAPSNLTDALRALPGLTDSCVCVHALQGKHADRLFTICYLPTQLAVLALLMLGKDQSRMRLRIVAGLGGFCLIMFSIPLVSRHPLNKASASVTIQRS